MEILISGERELINLHIRNTYDQYEQIEVDSIDKLKISGTTNNLFKTKNLYVIRNDYTLDDTILNIKIGSHNKLILIYDKIDKRKKIFKTLKKYIRELNKPKTDVLAQYVFNNCDKLDKNDIYYFLELCNEDLTSIKNEINKLNFLKEEKINREQLDKIILKKPEDKIFDMLEYFVAGKLNEGYILLNQLYELNESPIKIFSLLYNKVKQVLIVQELQDKSNKYITDNYGISNYIIYKTKSLINKKTTKKLLNTLKSIKEYDEKIKTGKIQDKIALEITLQELSI